MTVRPRLGGRDKQARCPRPHPRMPALLLELLGPILAPTAQETFTYSPTWLRTLMTHLTNPRFARIRREMTTPLQYTLIWRGVLSVAGLYAQLGATVPARGFKLAYSPGFRHTNADASSTKC